MKELQKLTPIIFDKIWGGQKLKRFKETELSNIGETWEVSTHPNGVALVGDKKLNDFVELDYLVKFIDTDDNLSVQVHPDDEYARKNENDNGKPECWFILDAEEEAGIYLGFKEGVSAEQFELAIKNKDAVNELLNFVPVKKGMFINLPTGSVHAIGKGVTLCEVQRSSDVTYRVWDWNRLDSEGNSRELHIKKAMDVMNFDSEFNKTLLNEVINDCFNLGTVLSLGENIKILPFKPTEKVSLVKDEVIIDLTSCESFYCFEQDEYLLSEDHLFLKISRVK